MPRPAPRPAVPTAALVALTALFVLAPAAVPTRAGAEELSRAAEATSAPADFEVDGVAFHPVGDGSPVGVGGGAFRGWIEVLRTGGGLGVVNDVTFDDYLRGIVEVPTAWPMEALQAQVIAARTYALWQMWSPSSSAWRAMGADICATDACQVYRGVAGEERPQADRWIEAVASTAGQLLLKDGGIIKSVYSSSNGGAVRGAGAGLAHDPDDTDASPYRQWRSVLPVPHLLAALGLDPGLPVVEAVNDQGVVRLTVESPDGVRTAYQAPPDEFRRTVNGALGTSPGLPSALPSPFFSLAIAPDGVVAEGSGHGHGRGLSQYGALGKALRGMSAEQILSTYYGLAPTEVDPAGLPPRIRVGLATGVSEVAVQATEPATVVDLHGDLVAPAVTGTWRVVPSGSGVRLVPPEEFAGPLTARVQHVAPARVVPRVPVSLQLSTSLPAVVTISVTESNGSTTRLPAQVVEPGTNIEQLPAARDAGTRRIDVEIDAGSGRTSTLHLWLPTLAAEPTSHTAPAPPAPGGVPMAVTLAGAGLVLANSGILGRLGWSRRSRSGGASLEAGASP